ncbi:hypothetical protein M441DRAFT_165917 [Trichoderma asperellum CBS 433.97]|uniref:DUF6546 domain-containing protein n=1 Tax=Trichoderma asperellum (strain ATCC 204424 / CBS 433.97 / NBRC 101777) TaxID=1042311 RepID=A0A2T3ZCL9_TRIA4|nr:hypothetical protein M441DRAFT_165917 [Trichoderma asperellum CBS 433.97]PTB42557.1 hypothetical protein M441DRAFT_165917 [Trichoderma asperellum CBS 433.97]
MADWRSLPAEVRIMILDRIVWSGAADGNITGYATVSREWQAYFEPLSFRRLVLNHSRVADFGKLTRNRKWMVKHIWLRVELPRYHCPRSGHIETPDQTQRNNQIFTQALWQLLKVLGSWGNRKVYDPVDGTGPVLELSAHSPSDMKHRFDACAMDKDVYPHISDENCTDEEFSNHIRRELRKDGNRGHHCQAASHPDGTVAHLCMFQYIQLDFSAIKNLRVKKLPRVDAIKGLILRRQHYRRFSARTVAEIARSFHTIGNVIYEPIFVRPRFADRVHPQTFEQEYRDLICETHRFNSFSIFMGYYAHRDVVVVPIWKLSDSFSLMLADESHSLEHLSQAFVGDALMFFQDFLQPGSLKYQSYLDSSRGAVQKALLAHLSAIGKRVPSNRLHSPEEFEQALLKAAGYEDGLIPRSIYKPQWPKLKTLALTSRFHLVADPNRKGMDIFEAAGFAALEMPELQTMEIWSSRCHDFFRYCRNDEKAGRRPTITLGSHNNVAFEPRVSIVWDRVARKHSNHGITAKTQILRSIRAFPTEYPYQEIDNLELREKIVHPISLCEFRWFNEGWERTEGRKTFRFLPWPL